MSQHEVLALLQRAGYDEATLKTARRFFRSIKLRNGMSKLILRADLLSRFLRRWNGIALLEEELLNWRYAKPNARGSGRWKEDDNSISGARKLLED